MHGSNPAGPQEGTPLHREHPHQRMRCFLLCYPPFFVLLLVQFVIPQHLISVMIQHQQPKRPHSHGV